MPPKPPKAPTSRRSVATCSSGAAFTYRKSLSAWGDRVAVGLASWHPRSRPGCWSAGRPAGATAVRRLESVAWHHSPVAIACLSAIGSRSSARTASQYGRLRLFHQTPRWLQWTDWRGGIFAGRGVRRLRSLAVGALHSLRIAASGNDATNSTDRFEFAKQSLTNASR